MPELPEIESYLAAMEPRLVGTELVGVRIQSFSLLRTFDPPPDVAIGSTLMGLERIGKRIVMVFADDIFFVVHLMVAGRLHWMTEKKKLQRKYGLAAFDFSGGSLTLTEAGTKRRASLHVVRGRKALSDLDPGGIEIAGSRFAAFKKALLVERHTLKRALTDARHISGIGGAFADEIMHRAGLSPLQMNTNLDDAEIKQLHAAAKKLLKDWTKKRIDETGDAFPEKVTAFHPDMAVHGKYNEPCPVCGAPIQRIVYASRETNYCPGCQTGGKVLADRSMSRLLKDDWPSNLDELEGIES